jgi:stress-induced morphogen
MNAIEEIVAKLQQELQTQDVEIFDFSQGHEGHHTLDIGHLNLHLKGRVKSSKFNGLNRLSKERLVQKILWEEIKSGKIHALSLNLEPTE